MYWIKITFITLIFLTILLSCKKNEETFISELNDLTESINYGFVSSKSDLDNLGMIAQKKSDEVYLNENYTALEINNKYSKIRSMYYKAENDGKCAFWSSGRGSDKEVSRFVTIGEQIENDLIYMQKSNDFISHVWFISDNTSTFKYPFEDLISTLPEGLDASKLSWWIMANKENNPGGKSVWTPEPFIGLYGGGWILTAVYPVYRNQIFIASVTLDVSIKEVVDRYIKGKENFYLLLSNKLVLIGASDSAKNKFKLNTIEKYNYLEQMHSHPDISWKYNIQNTNTDSFLNNLANIINEKKRDGTLIYNEKQYNIAIKKIESVGFYLVTIY